MALTSMSSKRCVELTVLLDIGRVLIGFQSQGGFKTDIFDKSVLGFDELERNCGHMPGEFSEASY